MENTRKVYVTVYKDTQAYGGPEEGGWYYTEREPIDGLCTLCCGTMASYEYTDDNGHPAIDTWLDGFPESHTEDCLAREAAERYHRRYVLGHTEEYLKSFTHRPDGVSWLDSNDDTPREFRGEVSTNGKHSVRIESEPPNAYPQDKPHYS